MWKKHICLDCQGKKLNTIEREKHLKEVRNKTAREWWKKNRSKGLKVGGQAGARRHTCSQCKGQKLNDQDWKAHIRKLKNLKRAYFKKKQTKEQMKLLELALSICKFYHCSPQMTNEAREFIKRYDRK